MFTDEQSTLQSRELLRGLASRLRSLIEPDFGLLDQLLSQGALSREQYDVIRGNEVSVYQRNDRLLQYMTRPDVDPEALMYALQQTDQPHVVNFIQQQPGKTYPNHMFSNYKMDE